MQTESSWLGGAVLALPFVVFLFMFAGFAIFIGAVFYKALRGGKQRRPFSPAEQPPFTTDNFSGAPLIVDDSLTNPANPLYHVHHSHDSSASSMGNPTGFDSSLSHQSSSPVDVSPPSTSFDVGASSTNSVDTGSASGGCSQP